MFYHPATLPEYHIGIIRERYPDMDIALVELDEGVVYINLKYFDAPISTKLSCTPPEQNKSISLQKCDRHHVGISSIAHLLAVSPYAIPVGTRAFVTIKVIVWIQYVLSNNIGVNFGKLTEGICGAPVVIDDDETPEDDEGAVLGFLRWTDSNVIEDVLVPVLNDFITAGWMVE